MSQTEVANDHGVRLPTVCGGHVPRVLFTTTTRTNTRLARLGAAVTGRKGGRTAL